MTITVSVVENDKAFCASLLEWIKSAEGLELISHYSNVEDAIEIIEKGPDIVIMDLALPGSNGLNLINSIRDKNERVQFLVCSHFDNDEKIFSALEAGVSGFISKDQSFEEIAKAIRELHNGGSPMSPSIARRVTDSFQKNKYDKDFLLPTGKKKYLNLWPRV